MRRQGRSCQDRLSRYRAEHILIGEIATCFGEWHSGASCFFELEHSELATESIPRHFAAGPTGAFGKSRELPSQRAVESDGKR